MALLILALIGLSGCSLFSNWDDVVRDKVGYPIERLRIDGELIDVIQRDDGIKEYRYHYKGIDLSCSHSWMADERGVIVGYKCDGRCRPVGQLL